MKGSSGLFSSQQKKALVDKRYTEESEKTNSKSQDVIVQSNSTLSNNIPEEQERENCVSTINSNPSDEEFDKLSNEPQYDNNAPSKPKSELKFIFTMEFR